MITFLREDPDASPHTIVVSAALPEDSKKTCFAPNYLPARPLDRRALSANARYQGNPGRSPARKSALMCGRGNIGFSREILHNHRSDELRQGDRQVLPHSNGHLVFWILGVQLGKLGSL